MQTKWHFVVCSWVYKTHSCKLVWWNKWSSKSSDLSIAANFQSFQSLCTLYSTSAAHGISLQHIFGWSNLCIVKFGTLIHCIWYTDILHVVHWLHCMNGTLIHCIWYTAYGTLVHCIWYTDTAYSTLIHCIWCTDTLHMVHWYTAYSTLIDTLHIWYIDTLHIWYTAYMVHWYTELLIHCIWYTDTLSYWYTANGTLIHWVTDTLQMVHWYTELLIHCIWYTDTLHMVHWYTELLIHCK